MPKFMITRITKWDTGFSDGNTGTLNPGIPVGTEKKFKFLTLDYL
jgi:hypothetical protein